VRGALELLLGTIKGNAAVAVTAEPGQDNVFIEAVHILEVVAPSQLHVGRFLPATPVRVIVDNKLVEQTAPLGPLVNGPLSKILGKTELCYKLMPRMIDFAATVAAQKAVQIVAASLKEMQQSVGGEVERLRDLQAINPNVRDKEIEAAQNQYYDLRDHLADARLRLDSVRIIFRSQH